MKKRILNLISILMALTIFAGCSASKASEKSKSDNVEQVEDDSGEEEEETTNRMFFWQSTPSISVSMEKRSQPSVMEKSISAHLRWNPVSINCSSKRTEMRITATITFLMWIVIARYIVR